MRTAGVGSVLLALLAVSTPPALAGGTIGVNVDALDFRILDAEYSKSLERIVAVSTTPQNRLWVYDPVGQSGPFVDLPLAATCVSVSPDGLQAAVGHNAWVTLVDLAGPSILATHPVPTVALDVVHGGNGWVYVFPQQDQWETIRCLNLASGQVTNHTGLPIYAGTKARLHPGGQAMYGANNGLSPSDIEKYSIVNGTAQRLYDSPYHGDYPMCGDLWFTQDGLRIVTRCGNTFRSSPVQSEDMTYTGSLAGSGTIQYADHSSGSQKIVIVPSGATADLKLRFYDQAFLNFEGEVALPSWIVGGNPFPTHGRFVFHDGAGQKAFVVLQADASSGLLLDSGVATYTYPGGCTGTWSATCPTSANSVGAGATLAFTGSLSASVNDTWVESSGCPPGVLAQFLFGSQAGQLPFGDGTLCISVFGTGIRRLGPALFVAPDGTAQRHVDFVGLPATAQIPVGAEQHYQLWYRDLAGPGGHGFNLSNGASATFCD